MASRLVCSPQPQILQVKYQAALPAPRVHKITRPSVWFGLGYHIGNNGIQLDIMHTGQQVAFAVN